VTDRRGAFLLGEALHWVHCPASFWRRSPSNWQTPDSLFALPAKERHPSNDPAQRDEQMDSAGKRDQRYALKKDEGHSIDVGVNFIVKASETQTGSGYAVLE